MLAKITSQNSNLTRACIWNKSWEKYNRLCAFNVLSKPFGCRFCHLPYVQSRKYFYTYPFIYRVKPQNLTNMECTKSTCHNIPKPLKQPYQLFHFSATKTTKNSYPSKNIRILIITILTKYHCNLLLTIVDKH